MRRAFPPDNPSQRLDLRTPTRLLQHKCHIFRIVRAIAASKIIRSGTMRVAAGVMSNRQAARSALASRGQDLRPVTQ
jgi:hypothetical protein